MRATRRPWFVLAALAVPIGCAGPPPPAPPAGWRVRYVERSGSDPERRLATRHPDTVLDVVDGRARLSAEGRDVTLRLDRDATRAELCQQGRCTPTPAADAMASFAGVESLSAAAGAREAPVEVRSEPEDLVVANLRTRGARFTTTLTHPAGSTDVTLIARWIADPTDPSARTALAYFLTPLRRLGATALADAVARSVGLPLAWEVVLVNRRADGTESTGVNAHRAAEIGNAGSGP